jgi:hypothetical protein
VRIGYQQFVVGEAPPLLAQAAQAPFVYIGAEPPAPEAEAISRTRARRRHRRAAADGAVLLRLQQRPVSS